MESRMLMRFERHDAVDFSGLELQCLLRDAGFEVLLGGSPFEFAAALPGSLWRVTLGSESGGDSEHVGVALIDISGTVDFGAARALLDVCVRGRFVLLLPVPSVVASETIERNLPAGFKEYVFVRSPEQLLSLMHG